MSMGALAAVLEASVKRNGEKPLTNAHLLSIVKMAQRLENVRAERREQWLSNIYNETIGEDRKWSA